MILIAHRGNVSGRNEWDENNPDYIESALYNGYDVEVDVRLIDGLFYLGHDEPQYEIKLDWLFEHSNKLWIHCKDIESMVFFNQLRDDKLNYFWHEEDKVTLTSKGYIWAYPAEKFPMNSIGVMPEQLNSDISLCVGICSDNLKNIYLD